MTSDPCNDSAENSTPKQWDGNLNWDDDVGAHIANQFQHWMDILGILSSLAVPRYLARDSFQQVDLHLFSDASEMAYGAAIYARTTSDAGIHTSLLAAKSRLAPRETVCIPRHELCSIVLRCKLLKRSLKSVQILQLLVDVSAWSNSTISFSWNRSTLNKYSIFWPTILPKINRCYQPISGNTFRLIKTQPIIQSDQKQ